MHKSESMEELSVETEAKENKRHILSLSFQRAIR
jgi:hypothetical protein